MLFPGAPQGTLGWHELLCEDDVEGGSVASTDEVAAKEPTVASPATLSERDRRILDFEREWSSHTGSKVEAAFEEFGLTAARYYQVLNTVIDSPEAIVYDPMLVRRLQRVRETRTRERTLLQPHETKLSRLS